MKVCDYCKNEFSSKNKYFCSRACRHKCMLGSNNANYRGGTITDTGYRKIRKIGHPRANSVGYVREHILVMEEKLGRNLESGEVVHHINHNRLDNRPENLELKDSVSAHSKYHASKIDRDARGRFSI